MFGRISVLYIINALRQNKTSVDLWCLTYAIASSTRKKQGVISPNILGKDVYLNSIKAKLHMASFSSKVQSSAK